MSDQPKPTGEWTAQTVFDLLGSDYGDDGWKRERAVADAHNAALAAATGRHNEVCYDYAKKLAAERELVADAAGQILSKQLELDSERGKVQTLVDAIHAHKELACCDSYDMLDAALAKVKGGK